MAGVPLSFPFSLVSVVIVVDNSIMIGIINQLNYFKQTG